LTDQIWTFTCSRCEYRIKVMDWQTTPRCPEHDCLLDLVDVQNEVKEVVMKYQMFVKTNHAGGLHAEYECDNDSDAIAYFLVNSTNPTFTWFAIYNMEKPDTPIYEWGSR